MDLVIWGLEVRRVGLIAPIYRHIQAPPLQQGEDFPLRGPVQDDIEIIVWPCHPVQMQVKRHPRREHPGRGQGREGGGHVLERLQANGPFMVTQRGGQEHFICVDAPTAFESLTVGRRGRRILPEPRRERRLVGAPSTPMNADDQAPAFGMLPGQRTERNIAQVRQPLLLRGCRHFGEKVEMQFGNIQVGESRQQARPPWSQVEDTFWTRTVVEVSKRETEGLGCLTQIWHLQSESQMSSDSHGLFGALRRPAGTAGMCVRPASTMPSADGAGLLPSYILVRIYGGSMVTVKVFQSGNSQAVRLPKELRLEVSELQVTRRGDVLILRPVAPGTSLVGAFDALAQVGDDFLPEGRQQGGEQEREAF